uniref:DUF4939 domain-containing protein n=1 Tax=Sinocyclocheilus grahami TaxID=75366 RepID=A0A672KWW5_SINGR
PHNQETSLIPMMTKNWCLVCLDSIPTMTINWCLVCEFSPHNDQKLVVFAGPQIYTIPEMSPQVTTVSAFGSGFLLQCSPYLEMQPHLFVTERVKVSFIISLLSGRALQWAEALWTAQSPGIHSLEDFVRHFREVFGQSTMEGIRCQNEEE